MCPSSATAVRPGEKASPRGSSDRCPWFSNQTEVTAMGEVLGGGPGVPLILSAADPRS